jgi:hypothetical protein
VAFVPLVDTAPSLLALARRRGDCEPLLDEFTQLALEVAALADET